MRTRRLWTARGHGGQKMAVGMVLGALVVGCSAPRPPAPPPGVRVAPPLGAIDIDELNHAASSLLEESLEASFRDEPDGEFDRDGDGTREYAVLALSGGGSLGAYGAGLLCGWTESGARPDFKVVSGVSTGSLQATFAFLGPAYDETLRAMYTQVETSQVYRRRSGLGALFSDALNDTTPFRRLLEQYFTDEVVAAVAERHERGHRLFVGTSNLDTTEFIIWDMGAIASSGHPGAAEHYRRILLASCSIPVFFPPVYFEVHAGDETYYEMHVDGATYSNVFFRHFMLDLDDAIEDAAVRRDRRKVSIYIVRNGLFDREGGGRAVPGRTTSIAATTIEDIFTVSGIGALFRVYVLAVRNGIAFNLASIPLDTGLDLDPTEFDPLTMQALFDLGFGRARGGYPWLEAPPFLDPDEVVRNNE